MVSVPTGGKKKKLKQTAAAMDMGTAYRNPHAAATERMATRNVNATVVGLTCSHFTYTKTISATSATHVTDRKVACVDGLTR